VPRRRLSIRKIGEVLRLKAAGLNNREVARSVGVRKTTVTVYEYLARAEGAGLSWPLPADLDESALEAKLFPPATAELAAARDAHQRHRVPGDRRPRARRVLERLELDLDRLADPVQGKKCPWSRLPNTTEVPAGPFRS
jgi:hypothetical protein